MKQDLFSKDENAVSSVVTAILILAVLTTFLGAINAYYLPSLAAEHEIHHMQDVRNSFSQLSASISSGNPSSRVLIPLGDGGLPFISSISSSGTITVDPEGSSFNISMVGAHPIEEQEYEIDENGIDGNGTTIEQIERVSSLTMQADTFVTSNFSVSIDENNSISICFLNYSEVLVTTYKNGTKIFNNTVLRSHYSNNTNTVNVLNLDLLNPRYRFTEVISETSSPFNLTFVVGKNSMTITGRFHINYDMLLDSQNVTISSKCGYFRYTSSNNQWIDQDYIFENGAVILKQGDNSTMRSDPFFDYGSNEVTIFIYNITGDKKSVGGNGASIVNVLLGDEDKIEYRNVSNFSIIMNAECKEAWNNYFMRNGASVASSQNGSMNITFQNSKNVDIIQKNIKVTLSN